jgi:hypothetical protein
MNRRLCRIAAMRIVTLAAIRWLGIHRPAPAFGNGKLTFDTLLFGYRCVPVSSNATSAGVPPQTKQLSSAAFAR